MSKLSPKGRMIRRDLADDEGMACLSDRAARLYFYLYPHLDWEKFIEVHPFSRKEDRKEGVNG
jgi:hypothetical protein